MKKSIAVFLTLFLLCAVLTGCMPHAKLMESPSPAPSPSPSESLQAEPSPSPEPVSLEPVPENVFYFSNTLEYNRLYRQNTEGTDLTLVLDQAVSGVTVCDGWVYYTTNENQSICRLNPKTGETKTLLETNLGPMYYYFQVTPSTLYYPFADESTEYETLLYALDLATGESAVVGPCWDMPAVVAGEEQDSIYSVEFVYGEGEDESFTCTLNQTQWPGGEKTVLLQREGSGISSMKRFGDCLSFIDNDHYGCYRISTGELGQLADVDSALQDVLWTDGEDYVAADGFGEAHMLFVHQKGQDSTISLDTLSYLNAMSALPGAILFEVMGVRHDSGQEDWEYTYDHYVLDTDQFTFAKITVPGECGRLFQDGSFPQIDTSTSRKPVADALYSLFVTNYGYDGKEPLCSKTHGAWLNIADGDADIAFLCAPTEEEKEELAKHSVQVEQTRFCAEALVFITNTENPVQNLSQQQLRDIYTGSITNWKEVGGPDQPITVYYRNDQSGSQRTFERFLFADGNLPDYEALGFQLIDEMSTIVDEVSYNAYAIGYSVLTYVSDLHTNENVRLLNVDSVPADLSHIADASYPFQITEYIVLRTDEPENSPVRKLKQWFLENSIAKELLVSCGVTPLDP